MKPTPALTSMSSILTHTFKIVFAFFQFDFKGEFELLPSQFDHLAENDSVRLQLIIAFICDVLNYYFLSY